MKILTPILFFLIANAHGTTVLLTPNLKLADLKSGDVLAQSIVCGICELIEKEEGGPYSHVGVVLADASKVEVLQAWNGVERVSLEHFISKRRPRAKTLVLRPKNGPIAFETLNQVFKSEFEGKKYDSAFLWDNRDDQGEQYYCSELVVKLMNPFLSKPIPPKPMHYRYKRAEWIRYFRGEPPDGKPGVSPMDIVRSASFQTAGWLDNSVPN